MCNRQSEWWQSRCASVLSQQAAVRGEPLLHLCRRRIPSRGPAAARFRSAAGGCRRTGRVSKVRRTAQRRRLRAACIPRPPGEQHDRHVTVYRVLLRAGGHGRVLLRLPNMISVASPCRRCGRDTCNRCVVWSAANELVGMKPFLLWLRRATRCTPHQPRATRPTAPQQPQPVQVIIPSPCRR